MAMFGQYLGVHFVIFLLGVLIQRKFSTILKYNSQNYTLHCSMSTVFVKDMADVHYCHKYILIKIRNHAIIKQLSLDVIALQTHKTSKQQKYRSKVKNCTIFQVNNQDHPVTFTNVHFIKIYILIVYLVWIILFLFSVTICSNYGSCIPVTLHRLQLSPCLRMVDWNARCYVLFLVQRLLQSNVFEKEKSYVIKINSKRICKEWSR